MNTLNKTLLAVLLTCLAALPALAGPSDGGGTNLVIKDELALIKEDELVDFAKFRKDHGEENYLLNARKFRQPKGSVPVYEQLKPLIDRSEQLYPGLGQSIDKAFEKPWLVIDAEFAGRKAGERKVISQTDTAVYISLKWLRSASPEQVRQAFFHEGVRNFAKLAIPALIGSTKTNTASLEDEITETLTPALYKKLPGPMLDASMEKMQALLKKFASQFIHRSVNKFISRADLYADLKATDGAKTIRKICTNANDGFWENVNINRAENRWADELMDAKSNAKLMKYSYTQNYTGEPSPTSLDESAEATMFFFRDLVNHYRDNATTAQACKAKKYEAFLKQYEQDQGNAKITGEELEELPDAPAVEKAAE